MSSDKVEKARRFFADHNMPQCTVGHIRPAHSCGEANQALDALIAAVREEQVAHVANCLCHDEGGCIVKPGHSHPYRHPHCISGILALAKVRVEVMEKFKRDGAEDFVQYSRRILRAHDEARAEVESLTEKLNAK